MKNQKGFTLIELLLVLAIIGIISAIAIPALLGQRENARNKSTASNAAALVSAVQVAVDICENTDYLAAARPVTDLRALAQNPLLSDIFPVVLARTQVAAVRNPFDTTAACYIVATQAAPLVPGSVTWVSARVLGQTQGTVQYGLSIAGALAVHTEGKVVESTLAP